VGADGLHSRARELAFGPECRYERYLGQKAAAFQVQGYRPRDELVYVMYSQVGQQVARFAMRDDRTMFLFTFADPDPRVPSTIEDQRAVLRERFNQSGWECPDILEALDSANDLYFDRVSQIVMSPAEGRWTRGRVTLVGDAAAAISLLGGQGAALAMIGAYILAGELSRAGGDVVAACHRYQRRFGAFIGMKQRAARRFAGVFAPRSKRSLFLRNQIMRLLTIPSVAALTAGRGFSDRISLPDY
jgi:2-polyprenyl-6-methoxyphenol hydroxylase-like FAD-dependent oxidoreductase